MPLLADTRLPQFHFFLCKNVHLILTVKPKMLIDLKFGSFVTFANMPIISNDRFKLDVRFCVVSAATGQSELPNQFIVLGWFHPHENETGICEGSGFRNYRFILQHFILFQFLLTFESLSYTSYANT